MGTRPEAIKLCPLIRAFTNSPDRFRVSVCATGQHAGLADQVFEAFGVTPDHRLALMTPGQTLSQSTARIVTALEPVLASEKPAITLVQGDTTTTLCGALAAFYQGIPVGHVEAGLRTHDITQPFPEEMNRVLTTRLAALHFCPTSGSADNLRAEGVSEERIHVTGNTGIDAVLQIAQKLESGGLEVLEPVELDPHKKLILVTAHRRESFGDGFEHICEALIRLAERDDVQILYPAHPNPNVQAPVQRLLASHPGVSVIAPLDYVPFVNLMRRAHLLITDSGGVQEEGPSLGKPILVLREKTERPEAVDAGTVRLVGTDVDRILIEATTLLDDPAQYEQMTRRHNPYGDGHASEQIVRITERFLSEGA
jgi:UDP-N-acetylglucosamine 2-epimerase (non-hydrolysing)